MAYSCRLAGKRALRVPAKDMKVLLFLKKNSFSLLMLNIIAHAGLLNDPVSPETTQLALKASLQLHSTGLPVCGGSLGLLNV